MLVAPGSTASRTSLTRPPPNVLETLVSSSRNDAAPARSTSVALRDGDAQKQVDSTRIARVLGPGGSGKTC